MKHVGEIAGDMNLPVLSERERKYVDDVLRALSPDLSTTAIFTLANELYDMGMDRVVEEEL